MPLFEAVRLALQTIRVQKLKSFFTLAGVCIGVMFLITVVSIIDGMGRYMKEDLVGKLLAVNSFELRRRPNINIGDVDQSIWDEYRRRPRLFISDLLPVVEALPEGTRWAMEAEANVTAVSRWSRPRSTNAIGIDGDWFAIKNIELKDGRPFTAQELSQGENVIIIGPDMVDRAFPGLDPLGRELRIGGVPYRVVGVTESRGSAFGISFDNFVIGPWRSPIRKLLNPEPQMIDAVIVQTANAALMTEAQERTRAVMRTRRGLRPGQKDNFSMETSASALEFWNKIEAKLQLFGIALPVVGLVVGAIVIMNIMLVAVAERTREIGIRKALGAKRRDILAQFLIESATLSTLGAVIGIALGIGLAQLIAAVSPLPASVAPWSIAVGVVTGVVVGIVSGVYPASRASLLDPIAALRQSEPTMNRLSNWLYQLRDGVTIALESIIGNKVRAALTILGVAVGVFVVVVISAAVHGINESVAKDFESTGPTTFFVTRYPITFEVCDGTEDTCKWLRNPPINWNEIATLGRLENAAAVGVRMDWSGAFKYRDKALGSAPIEAYTANWALFGAPDMLPGGRAFTEQEVRGAARVVVLNTTMADRLFGESEALGKVIAISGIPFTVIGVFKETGSFLSGADRPKGVMPVTTLQRALNASRNDVAVVVKPRAGVARDVMVDDVTAALRGARGLRPSDESTFAIITQDKLMETYDKIFGMFFLVMIALSAVGLIVGGVGVVAIMMISVTERTREIGVRKALGATRATILWQFLIEAVTLTGIGAIIGLAGGWVIAFALRSMTSIAASVPPLAVLSALIASAVTGVAFGMLPAFRASRLDPVEALRHE